MTKFQLKKRKAKLSRREESIWFITIVFIEELEAKLEREHAPLVPR